jgi:hypothetical protein
MGGNFVADGITLTLRRVSPGDGFQNVTLLASRPASSRSNRATTLAA